MTHQLEVHALSPLRPAPDELLAQAALPGLPLELRARRIEGDEDTGWEELELFVEGEAGTDVVARLRTLDEHGRARRHARWRQEKEAGEDLPDFLFESEVAYVLDLEDGAQDEGEDDRQAAFILAAWSLATLTEGLVVDEEAGIIADAESFWELLTEGLEAEPPVAAAAEERAPESGETQGEGETRASRPSRRRRSSGRRGKSARGAQRANATAREERK
ncbi:MAG: hypothetical protein AAF533_16705 [Acidobacteriota bacterium]